MDMLIPLVALVLVALAVWRYAHQKEKEASKPAEQRMQEELGRRVRAFFLCRMAAYVCILSGLGLGGRSFVPETPDDFPLVGFIVFVALGILILYAVHQKEQKLTDTL
jgi:ABC-type Fe3+ transport system permease subunit